MKKRFLFVLFAFTMLAGYSQEFWPDTIYHFEQGNSLLILDRFNYNCACGFKQEMQFVDNTVSIFEVDTIPEMANCICSFEILTEIENLEMGEYLFNYYRVGKMSDTSLVYSFIYSKLVVPLVNIPIVSFLAGACGETVYAGIFKNKASDEIQIWPNPAEDVLQVICPGNLNILEISLLDATGRKLTKENTLLKSIALDFSRLMPGIYFILCKTNSEVLIKKVLKN